MNQPVEWQRDLERPPMGMESTKLPDDWGNKHPLISYDLGYHPGASVFTAKSWYKMREKQRIEYNFDRSTFSYEP